MQIPMSTLYASYQLSNLNFKKVAIIEERWYIYNSYINLLLDQITRWPSKLLIVFGSTCTYLGGIDLEWRNLYNYFKVHLYCPNIVNLLCTQICDFYGDNLCLENKWRQDVRNLYIRRCIKLCSIHYKNLLLENSNSLIIQNKIFNKSANRGVWFQHLKNLGT